MGCLNGPEIETLEDGRSLADLVSQPVEMAARPQALDLGKFAPWKTTPAQCTPADFRPVDGTNHFIQLKLQPLTVGAKALTRGGITGHNTYRVNCQSLIANYYPFEYSSL